VTGDQELKEEPSLVSAHLRAFVDRVQRLAEMIDLTEAGAHALVKVPALMQNMVDTEPLIANSVIKGEHDEEFLASIKQISAALGTARRRGELAQREVAENFPVLKAQAVISLWTYLEATMRRIVLDCIATKEGRAVKEVAELRVPLGDYESLDEESRHELIFELFEKNCAAGLMNGVKRFEVLLQPFGLGGKFFKDWQKDIYELGQVRNVLLHRGGVVDRRFRKACPWRAESVGQHVITSDEDWRRFVEATNEFLLEILIRDQQRNGRDMTKSKGVQRQRHREAMNKRYAAAAGEKVSPQKQDGIAVKSD
jgi:hypothetical protein